MLLAGLLCFIAEESEQRGYMTGPKSQICEWQIQSQRSVPRTRLLTSLLFGLIPRSVSFSDLRKSVSTSDPLWELLLSLAPRALQYPHMPGFVLTFLWPVSICVLNLEALLVRKLWVYYHWNAKLHFVNAPEPVESMGKYRFCFWWAGSFTNLNPEAELRRSLGD